MSWSVTESDDLSTYANQRWISLENFTTVCSSLDRLHGRGSFIKENPLNFAFPLLLLQFYLASITILLISRLLRPLNQPLFVAQTLGGIILGPSVLGRSDLFTMNFFPLRSFVLLDVISTFGFMLSFFLVGVQADLRVLKKVNKNALLIGILTALVPMVLSETLSFLLPYLINVDIHLTKSLPVVAQAQSMVALPTISYFLGELKIKNSEFARVAMSTSAVSGLLGFIVTGFIILANQSLHDSTVMFATISSAIVVLAIVIFIVRPTILWLIEQNPAEAPFKRKHFVIVLVVVLVTTLCSQASGLHSYFGPLIVGLVLPAEPPIGSAIREKLHMIIYWVFLPLYFVKNGLVVDLFRMKLHNYIIVQSVALVAGLGKFMGAFITSRCRCNMPTADAITLGLVMNAQGFLELCMLMILKKYKVIDTETFACMYISMLIINAGVTPIIKWLYNSSKRYVVYKRRSVMHAKPESKLRLLVCLHDQEIAPTAINILEALHPTEESRLAVCVLHLVEIVGRTSTSASPLLISHKHNKRTSSSFGTSEGIFEAFRYYERGNLELVSVYPYTAISPCATMHDEICTLALDKRTSLVIIPFYKKFHPDGTIESYQNAALIMNKNVLDKVPCSVAILVDRGLLKSSWPVSGSSSPYRVGVVFLGGADDREALAIGARMAEHPKLTLTMIRILVAGNITGNDLEERRADNEFLNEFRQAMIANYRVTYIEEVVVDGIGTAAVIRSLENDYELVLVGRSHDKQSPLMSGFEDWSERTELGAIGEILASAEFKGNTTVLVVQQHSIAVKEHKKNRKHSLGDPDSIEGGNEEMPIRKRSV